MMNKGADVNLAERAKRAEVVDAVVVVAGAGWRASIAARFGRGEPRPARCMRRVVSYRDGVHGGWIVEVRDAVGRLPGWYPGIEQHPYGGRLQWHERGGVEVLADCGPVVARRDATYQGWRAAISSDQHAR